MAARWQGGNRRVVWGHASCKLNPAFAEFSRNIGTALGLAPRMARSLSGWSINCSNRAMPLPASSREAKSTKEGANSDSSVANFDAFVRSGGSIFALARSAGSLPGRSKGVGDVAERQILCPQSGEPLNLLPVPVRMDDIREPNHGGSAA